MLLSVLDQSTSFICSKVCRERSGEITLYGSAQLEDRSFRDFRLSTQLQRLAV